MEYNTLKYEDGVLKLIDQRKLPTIVEYYQAKNYKDIEYAISEMVVRGAPAIGAAAAYGVFFAARQYKDRGQQKFLEGVIEADQELACSRPTAVNLIWAVKRMEGILKGNIKVPREELLHLLEEEASLIAEEDIKTNRRLAAYGNEIVPDKAAILTHCNAGALATVDYGTALGVIREAHLRGKDIRVFADETRPRLQGARLTSFELNEEGIPVTLIADSVAATLIRDGEIDLIVVGADRIAANGDTANKIGTYMLSELAVKFKVPFYIAAPISTIDFAIESGSKIEIEERSPREVTHLNGIQVAPDGVDVYNPAFDVTPAENITGIITEKGIIEQPLEKGITELLK